jgi:hypothetical protein
VASGAGGGCALQGRVGAACRAGGSTRPVARGGGGGNGGGQKAERGVILGLGWRRSKKHRLSHESQTSGRGGRIRFPVVAPLALYHALIGSG